MSSTTSRVSLYKPAGGEDINVTTDLNNNYDKIDTNLNFRVVANAAARNAITPFWAGLNVRETDTGKLYVSNGSAPISGSWKAIPVQDATFDADLDLASGKQVNIGGVASTASFAVVNAAVGDDLITSRVGADTQSRYLVNSDGSTWWGGGSATQDTNLYRSAANTLTTDDNLEVGQNALVSGNATVTGDLTVGGVGQILYAASTANQNLTVSSTAMQNVTNLVIAVAANGVYTFSATIFYTGNGTNDIKLGFTLPSGAAIDFGGHGPEVAMSSAATALISTQNVVNGSTPTTPIPYGATGTASTVFLQGQIRVGANAGNVQLQAAQNTSNASATVVVARTNLTAIRVA